MDTLSDLLPDFLFHMHIPKTAGTALREALKRALPQGHLLAWDPPNPFNVADCVAQLSKLLQQNPSVRVISGHFLYGTQAAVSGKSYKFFTVVRDPISRILSHYVHDIQNNLPMIGQENVNSILDSINIADYASSGNIGYFYNNLHARYISGVTEASFGGMTRASVLDLCLSNIKRDYMFVASQSTLLADTISLFGRLGLPVPDLRSENSRGRQTPSDVLSTDVLLRLKVFNEIDYALLDHLTPGSALPVEDSGDPLRERRYDALMLQSYKTAIRNLVRENGVMRGHLARAGEQARRAKGNAA